MEDLEANYVVARDGYVSVRDSYSDLLKLGPVPDSATEVLLSVREGYAAAYTALMLTGVTPEAPPPDPRYVMRDRSTKEVEVEHE
jgi:hypothetical protein